MLTRVWQDELGYEGEFMFDRAVGVTISWKPDQDLTKEIEIKKQRNKHTNKTRLVRKVRNTLLSRLTYPFFLLLLSLQLD
jgi:nucleosome assembly protein 1-like 1